MATLKVLKLFLSTLSIFICFPILIQGEVIHITVVTVGYTNVGTSSNLEYQCYRSVPDIDALLSFGRSAPITTDRSPPEDVQVQIPYLRVVRLPVGDGWNSDGFGPFYCEASKPDRDVARVTTFYQRSDAKFISRDGLVTKTVNVNETGVMISMDIRNNPDASDNVITWMKDGIEVLTSFDGQTQISFQNPIQTSDQGIYEIYYANERNQSRGGLYRLIVRECPAGKWGLPECYGICDKCYNGGVCDDKSGLCICPNNFNGTNCLEICRTDGGNRFGFNCEFRCDYTNDPKTQCHGFLYCLPDPYGCSCDVGAHGLACTTLCTIGTYGPGCSQTCHCAERLSCNIYSGICTYGGCQTGWSGDNCQIPDECENGYYGSQCTDKCHCLNDEPCDKDTGGCPEQKCALGYKVRSDQVECQECAGGTFSLDCLQQCHSALEACETERGLCKGQCLDSWIGPYCQIAPSPINVAITHSNSSSFTVSWSTPLPSNINGNIQKYIIRYKRTDPAGDGNYKMEEVLTGAFDGEHIVMDLVSEINYTVQVRTVNGAGSSNWSEPVNAKTILSGDDNGTRIPLGAVIGSVLVPLVIIVILISTVVMYRRIKQRRLNAEPAASPPNTAHETSSTYGNPAFDDSDTHSYQDVNTDTPNLQNLTDAHTYQDLKNPNINVNYQNVTKSDPGDTYEDTV